MAMYPRSLPSAAITELLTNRNFILLVLYFTLPALAAWVVRDWMPAILQKAFNISQGKAGVSASLYWQGAALLSAILGGWLADRWMRRSERGRVYVSAIGMMLIVPAMFGVGNAPALNSFALAIASLILFGIGWGFFDCNNMPILSQITRPELRATGYGVMNFVSMMCGGVADWGFGAMTDRGVPLNMIFGVFALVCVVSLGIVLMIRPKREAVGIVPYAGGAEAPAGHRSTATACGRLGARRLGRAGRLSSRLATMTSEDLRSISDAHENRITIRARLNQRNAGHRPPVFGEQRFEGADADAVGQACDHRLVGADGRTRRATSDHARLVGEKKTEHPRLVRPAHSLPCCSRGSWRHVQKDDRRRRG
jgi:hypothetical protein